MENNLKSKYSIITECKILPPYNISEYKLNEKIYLIITEKENILFDQFSNEKINDANLLNSIELIIADITSCMLTKLGDSDSELVKEFFKLSKESRKILIDSCSQRPSNQFIDLCAFDDEFKWELKDKSGNIFTLVKKIFRAQ